MVSSHKELNVAKLQPVVALRSLLPRSRPIYIMQAVVVLYCTHGNTIFNTFWLQIIPYRIQDCEGGVRTPAELIDLL